MHTILPPPNKVREEHGLERVIHDVTRAVDMGGMTPNKIREKLKRNPHMDEYLYNELKLGEGEIMTADEFRPYVEIVTVLVKELCKLVEDSRTYVQYDVSKQKYVGLISIGARLPDNNFTWLDYRLEFDPEDFDDDVSIEKACHNHTVEIVKNINTEYLARKWRKDAV